MARPLKRETPLDRLMKGIKINETTGCWEWQKSKNHYGYGQLDIGQKTKTARKRPTAAHRAAWILYNGEIPKGLFVCHKCDNPPCCNPEHMFLGTQKENLEDLTTKRRLGVLPYCMGKYRGMLIVGKETPSALVRKSINDRAIKNKELSEQIFQERKEGVSLKELSIKYGKHMSTISRLASGIIMPELGGTPSGYNKPRRKLKRIKKRIQTNI